MAKIAGGRHRILHSKPSFVRGFTAPLRGMQLLLSTPGVKRYALLPLIANIILYSIVLVLVIVLLANWDPQVGEWTFWGHVGGWMAATINWMLAVLKWLVTIPAFFVISYFTFTMMGMTVAAPFNDMLSERVERALCETKEEQRIPLRVTGKLMVLSILDALRILGMQIVFMLLAVPLLFIPIIGFLPMLLVIAYFTGLGFFDVSMARNSLRARHKKPITAERRSELLGLGLCMELLFMIPFAGIVLLPLGVAGATILYCEIDWQGRLAAHGVAPPPEFIPPRIRVSA